MPHDDAELTRLARAAGESLAARGWRLATAESCTGGWIAKTVTDVPGSSAWFDSAAVTYSNAAKTRDLGVDSALLVEQGAVSEPVVEAMARGLQRRTGCEAAIAVSGVAGPDGGSAEKPVGLVWFSWAVAGQITTASALFAGNREAVRRATVAHALARLLTLISDASP